MSRMKWFLLTFFVTFSYFIIVKEAANWGRSAMLEIFFESIQAALITGLLVALFKTWWVKEPTAAKATFYVVLATLVCSAHVYALAHGTFSILF